jgi:hypothetical protein
MKTVNSQTLANLTTKLCLIVLAFFSLNLAAAEAGQALVCHEYFVSPDGSDISGIGAKESPFKTLEKARDAVRRVIPQMTGDIVVSVRGGVYPVTQTIVFGPGDSGKDSHRIIYRAAEGETPIFTGGVAVTGWSHYRGDIWQAHLNRDHKLRALYVNDQRAVMTSQKVKARGGWGDYVVKAGQASWAWQSGQAADGVLYDLTDLPAITRNPENVEIENRTTFNDNFVGVRAITTESNHYVFKFQQPYGAMAQQIGWNAGLTLDTEHIVLNAFELLDHPGEFYFDQQAQTLYYVPRPGEDMTIARVMAPQTETLISLQGRALKHPVRNLTFEGLTFDCTDYNLLNVAGSVGKATVQTATVLTAFANANWHLDVYRAYDTLPGAITANAVEGVELIRNVIKHTGCDGVVMGNDIRDTKIIGNVISDCGGSAVTVGHPQHVYENDTSDLKYSTGVGIEHEKFPAGTEAAARHVQIADNFLPDDAALFKGHTIITVFFGQDVRIEHNWIPNAPYSGINLGWGWCDFDGSPVANNPVWGKGNRPSVFPGKPTGVCRNNVVRDNRVEDTVLILHDGGGIYTLGDQPGTVVERNYVRNSEQAIYTDEGSANMICRDNVIASPYTNAHYAVDYGRKHSIVIEKYFIAIPHWDVTAPDCVFTNYTVCTNTDWTRDARAIIKESGLESAYQNIVPAAWRAKLEKIKPPAMTEH